MCVRRAEIEGIDVSLPSSCPSDSLEEVGSSELDVSFIVAYIELLWEWMLGEDRVGASIMVE